MNRALRRLPSMPQADPPSAEERSEAEAAYVRAMLQKRRPKPVIVDKRGAGKRTSLAARRIVQVPVQTRRQTMAVVRDLRSSERTVEVSAPTARRDLEITPDMVGRTYAVHDGNRYVAVRVTGDAVGRRLSEIVRVGRRRTTAKKRRS